MDKFIIMVLSKSQNSFQFYRKAFSALPQSKLPQLFPDLVNPDIHQRHIETSFEFESATVKFSNYENKVLKFNSQSYMFAPFVIYFVFESPMKPEGSFPKINYSSTEVIEGPHPCDFCLMLIELGNPKQAIGKLERSNTSWKQLIFRTNLQKISARINNNIESSDVLIHWLIALSADCVSFQWQILTKFWTTAISPTSFWAMRIANSIWKVGQLLMSRY